MRGAICPQLSSRRLTSVGYKKVDINTLQLGSYTLFYYALSNLIKGTNMLVNVLTNQIRVARVIK